MFECKKISYPLICVLSTYRYRDRYRCRYRHRYTILFTVFLMFRPFPSLPRSESLRPTVKYHSPLFVEVTLSQSTRFGKPLLVEYHDAPSYEVRLPRRFRFADSVLVWTVQTPCRLLLVLRSSTFFECPPSVRPVSPPPSVPYVSQTTG